MSLTHLPQSVETTARNESKSPASTGSRLYTVMPWWYSTPICSAGDLMPEVARKVEDLDARILGGPGSNSGQGSVDASVVD